MTIFAACDPGLTGAIAFILPNGHAIVEDLPTIPIPGNGMVKRRIDGAGLKHLFRANVSIGDAVHFSIEDVMAIGGSAVQTMGSMMRSVGAIEAVIECMGLEVHRVTPQAWKKGLGLTREKAAALELARNLYPDLAHTRLKLAKNDGRAEALLIAHYQRGLYA